MIYLYGDLHVRKEEPFFSAAKETLEILHGLTDSGDVLIQLGDFFHTSKPYPKEYSMVLEQMSKMAEKGVDIIVMAGNNAHEYHYTQKTYAIDPLVNERVRIIKDPTVLKVEDSTFLFLPWVPLELARGFGAENIDDLYSRIWDFIEKPDKLDYVLYHFEDETVFMGGVNTGVDLTYLHKDFPQLKRIGGHIHLQSKNYIGTPYQTRYDEKGQIGRIYTIDGNSRLEEQPIQGELYPQYVDIPYDHEPFSKEGVYILTISGAPSVGAAYSKFLQDNTFIRDVKIEASEKRMDTLDQEDGETSSIKEYLQEYIKTNKVDLETSKYLLGLF